MKPIHIGIVLVLSLIILYFCYQKKCEDYTKEKSQENFQTSSLDVYYNDQSKIDSAISLNKCGQMSLPDGLKTTYNNKVEVLSASYYVDTNYSGKNYCDDTTAVNNKEVAKSLLNDITQQMNRTNQVSRAINYSLNNGGTLENIQCSSYFVGKCFPNQDGKVSGIINPEGACYFWNDETYGFGPQIAPSFKSQQTMEIIYLMNGIVNTLKVRYGQPINLKSSPQSELPTYNTDGVDGKKNFSRIKGSYPSELSYEFVSNLKNYSRGDSALSTLPSLKLYNDETRTSTIDIYEELKQKLIKVDNRIGVAIIAITANDLSNLSSNLSNKDYLKDIVYKSTFVSVYNSSNPNLQPELYPEVLLINYLNMFPTNTYFMFFPVGLSWNSQILNIAQPLHLKGKNNSKNNCLTIMNFIESTNKSQTDDLTPNYGNFLYVCQSKLNDSNARIYENKFFKKIDKSVGSALCNITVNTLNTNDSSTPVKTNVLQNDKFGSYLESPCSLYYPNSDDKYWPADGQSPSVNYGDSGNAFTVNCSNKFASNQNGLSEVCNSANSLKNLIGQGDATAEVYIRCKELNQAMNFERFGLNQSFIKLVDKKDFDKKQTDNTYVNSFSWIIEPIGNYKDENGVTNVDSTGFCYIYALRYDAVGQEVRNYLTANPDNTVSVKILQNTNSENSRLLSSRQQWLLCDTDLSDNNYEYHIRSRSNNYYLSYKISGGYPSGPSVFLQDKINTAWIFDKAQVFEPFLGQSNIYENFESHSELLCSSGISPFRTTANNDMPGASTTKRSNWNSCFASYWNGDYIYQFTDPNSQNPDYVTINLNSGQSKNEGTIFFPKLNGHNNLIIPIMAISSVNLASKTTEYPQVYLNMRPFTKVQLKNKSSPQNLVKLSGQVRFSSKPNDMVYIPGGMNPNMFMIKKTLSPLLVNQAFLAAKGMQVGTIAGSVKVEEDNKYVIIDNNNPHQCDCDKLCKFNINNKVKSTYKGRNWEGSKAVAQAYRSDDNILHIQDPGSSIPSSVKTLDCYCEEDKTMPFLADCKSCKDLSLPTGNSDKDILKANIKNCHLNLAAVSNLVKYMNGTGPITSFFTFNPTLSNGKWADYKGGQSDGNITLFSFKGYSKNIASNKNDMTPVNTYRLADGSFKTTKNIITGGGDIPVPTFSDIKEYKANDFPHYFPNTGHINPRKFSVYFEINMTGADLNSEYGLFGKDGYHIGVQIIKNRIFPYVSSSPNQYAFLNGRPASFNEFFNTMQTSFPFLQNNQKYRVICSWEFLNDSRCVMRISTSSNEFGFSSPINTTYSTDNVAYYPYDTSTNWNIGIQAAGQACNCNKFTGSIKNVMFFEDEFFTNEKANKMLVTNNLGIRLEKTVYLCNKSSVKEFSGLKPITIVNNKEGNSFIFPGTTNEFRLKFSCNPGSYPNSNTIMNGLVEVDSCCRGPYPYYAKTSGNVDVANNYYKNKGIDKKTEVVWKCESGLSYKLDQQGAGFGDFKNHTFETYYVEPLSFPDLNVDNNIYVFQGSSTSGNHYSVTPAKAAKTAIALMGQMGTANDLSTLYQTTKINTNSPAWVLAGNQYTNELKRGYVRTSGSNKSSMYGPCPDNWTPSGGACWKPKNGNNLGWCSNPSYFGGYTPQAKRNWAVDCHTRWTPSTPDVSLNEVDNKYKGVQLSNLTTTPADNNNRANLWVKGLMPIHFPNYSIQRVLNNTILNPLLESQGGGYWKNPKNNCFYSQYALQQYDNVRNPGALLDNRSLYLRQCK